MKNLIPSSNYEILRQMTGGQKINVARTMNAKYSCIHDIQLWIFMCNVISQDFFLLKLGEKSSINRYKQFKKMKLQLEMHIF